LETLVSLGEKKMSRYEDLKVYQRAVDLVVEVYRFSRSLPDEEKFGLIDQIRRAATSIPLNIAEGSSSSSSKVFNRYLETALGSGYEVKTVLTICGRRKYGDKELMLKVIPELDEIIAMIKGFIKTHIPQFKTLKRIY
jgi:four helix bundle protein